MSATITTQTQPSLSSTTSTTSHTTSTTAALFSRTTTINLISGGIAGCVAKTAIAPFDRVKLLFQVSNPSFRQFAAYWLGPFQAIRTIYHQEGFIACYRGHSATLARIFPYAALNYMCYEKYSHLLDDHIFRPFRMRSSTLDHPSHISTETLTSSAVRHLIAGSLAGMTSVTFTYPLDYVHSRISYQVKSQRYKGIFDTISQTIREGREDYYQIHKNHNSSSNSLSSQTSHTTTSRLLATIHGIGTLYRGFGPTLMGIVPYAGVSFATYDTMKRIFSRYYHDPKELPIAAKFASGIAAGITAQSASYPLDVIRRRMQLVGMSAHLPQYRNTRDAFVSILRTDGIRGLYVGLSINFFKVGPAHAISFITYEYCKQFMNQKKS
jgi:solute carrier family 25 protein 16